MKSIFLGLSLLMLTTSMHGVNLMQKETQTLTSREVFTQKYEAIFGEKPSDLIWSSEKDRSRDPQCRCCEFCKAV
jgi:hypothetical protein